MLKICFIMILPQICNRPKNRADSFVQIFHAIKCTVSLKEKPEFRGEHVPAVPILYVKEAQNSSRMLRRVENVCAFAVRRFSRSPVCLGWFARFSMSTLLRMNSRGFVLLNLIRLFFKLLHCY